MTEQEQIDEITQIICGHCKGGICLIDKTSCYRNCSYKYLEEAEELYNAGYRKVPENVVVLTKEEYERLKSDRKIRVVTKHEEDDYEICIPANEYDEMFYHARKETAKEIFKEIREHFVASYLLPTGLDLPAKRVKYAKITDDELDKLEKKYCVEVEE